MKNIYKSYHVAILFVLMLILTGGVFFFLKMQVSLFPEVTFPKVKIIADCGEQPVDKMMITVTKPLEEAVRKIPDLISVRSSTGRGSTEISVFLNWNADINVCLSQIQARISEIRNNLPIETQIRTEKMNPSILPVSSYSLQSNTKSPIELRQIAEYNIKPYLSQIQGISSVSVLGGKIKEYQIELIPEALERLKINPNAIENAVSGSAVIQSCGFSENYKRLYLTVLNSSLTKKTDIENITIPIDSVQGILLKDVANVKIGERKEYIKVNVDGKDGVLINILKQPEANLAEISSHLETSVAQLNKLLPPDVKLIPIYRQNEFVSKSIKSVSDALGLGLILSVIITLLFLRSFKPGFAILIIIPITLGLSVFVLYILHYTINIMTLGAIAAAVGLIIDDAVIITEQIYRDFEKSPSAPVFEIVNKSVRYLFKAMIGSTLTTVLVFLPFSLMGGVAGAYFKILANTMIIVLLSSFFTTALGLPVIYAMLAKIFPNIKTTEIKEKKHNWVKYILQRKWISVIIILILIISTIFVLPNLETGFLPEMDEGTIVLDFVSPSGTSLDETDKMLQKIDNILKEIPDVKSYSRRTGSQMGFFITEQNRGDYLIQLKENRKFDTETEIDEIRKKIEHEIPTLQVDFGQVIGDMLGDLMSSVQPIELKVFGTDPEILKQYALCINQIAESTSGTADVFNGMVTVGPSIEIHPNSVNLSRFGLTTADLQKNTQNFFEGTIVGSIQEKQQMTDIRMIYPGCEKNTIQDYKNSKIFLANGKIIFVNQLFETKIVSGIFEAERENLQSIIPITARLNNRDLGSVMKEIKTKIKKQIHFQNGYNVEYGGAYAEQQSSFHDLLTILVLAVLLIMLTLLFLFRKFKISLIILVISVLGISGSIIALYLTKTPMNVGSYTGLIMIAGIIAENAIFTYLQYQKNLKTDNRENSIHFAIGTRLRPKLMTVLSAVIALLPLAAGIGTGAQMHRPLAVAVIGGLLAAIPLLLVVLPTLILKFDNN
jgi:CzcA family heavy metal efflux pump